MPIFLSISNDRDSKLSAHVASKLCEPTHLKGKTFVYFKSVTKIILVIRIFGKILDFVGI